MAANTKRTTRRKARSTVLARGVTPPEPDDGIRGDHGIIASLVARENGTLRLVLDDARRRRDGTWGATRLYTSRDYPARHVRDLRLAAEELEQVGLALVLRLVAAERSGGHGD